MYPHCHLQFWQRCFDTQWKLLISTIPTKTAPKTWSESGSKAQVAAISSLSWMCGNNTFDPPQVTSHALPCLALPCRSELDCFGVEISNGTRGREHVAPRIAYRMNLNPTQKLQCPCLPERRSDKNRTVQVRERGSDLACAAMLCILRIYYRMRWTRFCVSAQISHNRWAAAV
jgi:hypothetical protein